MDGRVQARAGPAACAATGDRFSEYFRLLATRGGYYTAWARAATAHGFAAINPDSHPDGIEQDFDRLMTFLGEHTAEFCIDPNQLAVHAVSGNVTAAFPFGGESAANASKSRPSVCSTG
jgi:hypothetical protein